MTTKQTPGNKRAARKLTVKKETLKDLDVANPKGVKGGAGGVAVFSASRTMVNVAGC